MSKQGVPLILWYSSITKPVLYEVSPRMEYLTTIRDDPPRPSPIPLRVRSADDAMTVCRHIREQPRLPVRLLLITVGQ